ncbi:MAG: NAD(P)-binding domain-containing protein [Alphaproteobacteria bacterium]|nr:NAD(P)-binding domain-containing protein [Alphaproteobacteria bacterium]
MAADRFLVIGAGPVGLAVAKALGEAGIPYVQAEATDHVGGNWAHGVYDTAHIISSRRTTEYADWPMPADYPDFPSAAQMHAYYEAYADAHGLRAHLRFELPVVAVSPRADQRYDVTFGDGTTEVFKGVMVCNGHHWARRFPAWAEGFTGTLLHSKDYKRPAELAGRRVLVIGGGNSGCDIVSEAARVGACADWSLRRGYWFLPKTLFGTPTVELVKPWMPIALQRRILEGLIRVTVGRYEDYGLPAPDHRIFEAHPTVSTEVFHYLKHGRITPRPDVDHVDGQEVHFVDGSHATYDVVVCATGFDLAFPFLPPGTVPVDDKVAGVIAGMLLPEHRHLYVLGTSQPRYGLGPLVTPMAEVLARWVRLQDRIAPTLGSVLVALGQRPPTTHLVDPHAALQQLARARRLEPLIRWKARRMAPVAPRPDPVATP